MNLVVGKSSKNDGKWYAVDLTYGKNQEKYLRKFLRFDEVVRILDKAPSFVADMEPGTYEV